MERLFQIGYWKCVMITQCEKLNFLKNCFLYEIFQNFVKALQSVRSP